ncbi:uncharacterized protein LOC111348927 isoform X2 [Spodoptera litura]|uniref:Uncharacterized protein LOC111348927 isoform X2 n=1 Tax=Spodoptera litura TaxID=69820 RepID=A0A9J7DNS7_SPOLT|nr:uncharacterized protein LOC111348927 isoform X2 [Spodoptera litura]
MNTYPIIFVFVLFFVSSKMRTTKPYRPSDKVLAEREAQFFCYKHKSCSPGGSKVCGYDPNSPNLAVFEDLCALFKANCLKAGRFHLVPQVVCETKIELDKRRKNQTLQYFHIRKNTHKKI